MTERRYAITEKQLDALKKLAERFEASAPMGIPSWDENTSTERRDKLDELMERFQDVLNELEELMTALDDNLEEIPNDREKSTDILRDLRFFIEDIEGQGAAL